MDIEEAIQSLKFSTYSCLPFGSVMVNKEAIETVLNELERLKKYENLEWQELNELAVKDKIIELMAKELSKLNYIQYCNANNCDYPHCNKEKCIKQYFTKKATDNVGE